MDRVPEEIRYKPIDELRSVADISSILMSFRFNLWKTYQKRIVEKNQNLITVSEVTRIPIEQGLTNEEDSVLIQRVQHHLNAANDHSLAYIFCPLRNFEATMEECMDIGLSRLIEIMHLPIHDKNKKVDHKAAALVLKAYEMVELRVRGAHVQKNISLNLNANQTISAPKTVAELEEEITRLELEARAPKELPIPVLNPVQYYDNSKHAGSKKEEAAVLADITIERS